MSDTGLNTLVEKIALGDDKAFEKLYRQTARGVYAFLYTYFQRKEDVEDAMQTVYLKVKQYANTFKKGTNARAWLLQIAKNHALNELKKIKREFVEEIPEVAVEGIKDTFVMQVMQKVLTEEEQQIIILHVLWGYKHREISNIINLPIGTITSKYKRAIAKLKNALKEV